MPEHHLVPRVLLRRWAHPRSGLIEVFDRGSWRLTREDPTQFSRLPEYNTVLNEDGAPDDWIEFELLAGLDNAAALALRQIDVLPKPRSAARQGASKGWHANHFLSPRLTSGLAMWVAAQAVRVSAFRDAVAAATSRDVQRHITSYYESRLATATGDHERARLREMCGVRVAGSQFDQNALPHLMAHLIGRLGEILYCERWWAVQRLSRPALILGDDPVTVIDLRNRAGCGSYARVAAAGAEAVSMWLAPEETIRRALAVMHRSDLIVVPLGPVHLLTLSRSPLMRPGRYDMPDEAAGAYNALIGVGSRRWICSTPADSASEPSSAALASADAMRKAAIRS